jgi:hypothetical protein
MLAMRPAVDGDVAAVEAMIYARCEWLEERGLPSWRAAAPDLAAQASSGSGAMWVLEDEGGRIVGCTTVLTSTPSWGWTEQELAEPAYYLYTSVTDPAYQAIRPGTLMAWWAVDKAARDGRDWVRRGCLFPGLVRYYQRQGFTLAHEVQRTHHRVYLMGRRAEALPELARMFAADHPVSAVRP